MATDVLALGPFLFTHFSTPDRLPGGGRQSIIVHRMPGGERVIDCMGADDAQRQWRGTFWGDNALSDVLTLDAMRKVGEELPYSNGVEACTVIITEFVFDVRKYPQCIEYSIDLTTLNDGDGGILGDIFGAIGLDIDVSLGLLS